VERAPVKIALLGSTGSVGRQTLDVVREHPGTFEIVTLAAGSRADLLEQQVREFRPKRVSLDPGVAFDPDYAIKIGRGEEGLVQCATHPGVDIVVVATSGVKSIAAVIAAARMGRTIALANKEALVCAADLVLPAVRQFNAELRPVDSEHSAIWQCTGALQRPDVVSLTLTASGGPFRTMRSAELLSVTAEDALKHPTWDMGPKITIDSATLVNKGLEVIEAHRLFSLPFDRIGVVIHPESIVHSLVEFADGSTLAQLSEPDMRLPIQFALTAPDHLPRTSRMLDLVSIGQLTFERPDNAKFPALELCIAAGKAGGSACTALCAADDVAVDAFLAGRLSFPGIARVIDYVLSRHDLAPIDSLETIAGILDESTAVAEEALLSIG
jgi:1-deoxy-D-xylulose-5-phosphate reductoisomerase